MRQATLRLHPVERFKGGRGNHPAEIENNRRKCHRPSYATLVPKSDPIAAVAAMANAPQKVTRATDFSTGEELVLTVPPSRNQYYVVNYLDNYINTIGSIGTRTTPSDESTSYLLVGPTSKYARQKVAVIDGHEFPVMASDTNLNWMLIRILTSTLADSSAPNSTPLRRSS